MKTYVVTKIVRALFYCFNEKSITPQNTSCLIKQLSRQIAKTNNKIRAHETTTTKQMFHIHKHNKPFILADSASSVAGSEANRSIGNEVSRRKYS